jgi:hypothetical protein
VAKPADGSNGAVPRRDFDRYLNLEFHVLRTELEDITMDVKKFFADLFAIRKPNDPPSPALVVGVDAAHEAGRKVGYEAGRAEGYEAGHAEGYEAGRKAGYEDGHAEGYEVGRQAENEGSKAEGYDAGYKKGYDEGFQIGLFRGQDTAGTAASGTTIAAGTAGGGTAIELGGRASGDASEHLGSGSVSMRGIRHEWCLALPISAAAWG